ncbi:MAG: hypothetical protein K2J80_01115, partial [Oscillospiraceae bacterium]|nr:hypothetical protein [Oscillospiraceae bacterium]
MRPGKKILSALLATIILTAPVSTAFPVAYAAENDAPAMTFDGEYELDSVVPYYVFFDTANPREVREKLEKKLLSTLGKRDLSDVTFKDLQKVTTLNLSGLELADVPTCINYMTNLRTLNLSNNLLRNDGISGLSLIACTLLKNIDLSKNYLDRVPGWFVNERVTTKN